MVAEPIQRCVEVVMSRPERLAGKGGSDLSRALPGAVLREPAARLALHYAPGRWLFIEPDAGYLASTASEAHLFDVSGKWCQFRLEGNDARRALSSGCDPDTTLADRGCARLSLFDCPTIVVQLDSTITLCVEASYAASLQAAIGKLNLRQYDG
jgi:sarcosine oxidase gamma subunit